MGPKIIDALMDNGLIATFDDIFTLKKGDLLSLPRFAEKSVDNLLSTIEKSRQVTLARLIASLSIPQVGEETAIDIAKHIPDIEKANFEQLQSVYGVGDVVAKSVVDWFLQKKNKDLYHRLLKQITITKEKTSSKLSGKTFVLTGSLTIPRDEAQARIRALGGDVSSSVSSKTSYVVAGENAGSKLDKAKELDIPTLSETELLNMLQD
jgi:DNA ligase (NAD+)